jgi:hypothetical protein
VRAAGHNKIMQTFTDERPCWATVFAKGAAGEVWVELESGSIVPIDASAESLDLLEAGVSVLVDVDVSGQAVPWSTLVVTRTKPDLSPLASGVAEAAPVAHQADLRHLDDAGLRGDLADRPRTGVVAA